MDESEEEALVAHVALSPSLTPSREGGGTSHESRITNHALHFFLNPERIQSTLFMPSGGLICSGG